MAYYEPTANYPQDGVQSNVAQEQAEYQKIKAGLSDKLPEYAGNKKKLVRINDGGTAQTVIPNGSTGQILIEDENAGPAWGNVPPPAFVQLDNATAAIAWAVAHNTIAELILNGNKTIDNPTGGSDGIIVALFLIQDATGNRTVTWGSEFDWGEDGTPDLSTGASKRDFFSFVRRGSSWYNVGRSIGH